MLTLLYFEFLISIQNKFAQIRGRSHNNLVANNMRLLSHVLSELVATIGGVTRMMNKWVDGVRAAIIHITVGLKCV